MPVTLEAVVDAIHERSPNATLYLDREWDGERVGGIVVTETDQEEADIVRSQRIARYLRGKLGDEAVGLFLVYSPEEWRRKAAA